MSVQNIPLFIPEVLFHPITAVLLGLHDDLIQHSNLLNLKITLLSLFGHGTHSAACSRHLLQIVRNELPIWRSRLSRSIVDLESQRIPWRPTLRHWLQRLKFDQTLMGRSLHGITTRYWRILIFPWFFTIACQCIFVCCGVAWLVQLAECLQI